GPATLAFAECDSPFLAGAKLPSIKHSPQRFLSWSWSVLRKVRHNSRSTPLSSHSWRRRQHVVGLPYSPGKAHQGDPVHKIHKMPSKQRRSSARGRPPLVRGAGSGSAISMSSHCSSVRWCQAMAEPLLPAISQSSSDIMSSSWQRLGQHGFEIGSRLRELFRFHKKAPKWIQNPAWPINENGPMYFL